MGHFADRSPRIANSPISTACQRALRPNSRCRLAFCFQPLVEIGADRSKQRFDLAVKEMIGALHNLLLDHDALLGLQLVEQRRYVFVWEHSVLVAVNDRWEEHTSDLQSL